MGFLSILSCAHRLVEQRISPGDVAIDGTVGNGVDTVHLAKLVGPRGVVYGFDIQEQALESARERLNRMLPGHPGVRLFLRSHADLGRVVAAAHRGRIAAAMFNLGYLPGSDQSTITRPESTLPALEAAIGLLRPGGIVTVVVYPGHAGGESEAEAVERWAAKLPYGEYETLRYQFLNRPNRPPYLIAVEKRKPNKGMEGLP
jgi:threonine dehydrogenase-like Zn-dependent dehydrogenase